MGCAVERLRVCNEKMRTGYSAGIVKTACSAVHAAMQLASNFAGKASSAVPGPFEMESSE